jgi:hypothetical protein
VNDLWTATAGVGESEVLGQKCPDERRDLVESALEQEVAAGHQVDLGVRQVSGEGECPGGSEDRVALPPDGPPLPSMSPAAR